MSTPDQRARDKDRDAAIEVVEAAWADGQIIEADRDKRVESLLQAQTVHEVDMIVRDLQRPAPVPLASDLYGPATGSGVDVADVPDLDELQTLVKQQAPKIPRMVGSILIFVVIAVIGSVSAGIFAVVKAVSGAVTDGPSVSPLPGVEQPDAVNVLSVGGYDDLVAAVSETKGSSEAFEAVLYPTYAVVYLPVDGDSQRQSLWYWNGAMDDLESYGTSSYERFDLASVDPSVIVRLSKRVRGLVDSPTSWYAIVRAPDEDDGSTIWVYASNEYSETAYLGATADGKVVYDSTKVG